MQKKQTILVVASLLVVVLSVTLAYFTAQIIGKGKDVSVSSADLKIIFTETDGSISGTNIEPGWSTSKTFTITNKSNETYKYNIVIQDLINTFVTEGYLGYKITSNNGGYNMEDYKDVPKSETAKDTVLAYSASIDVGVTQTYTVEFVYANDENVNQNVDQNKVLSGKLFITEGTEEPSLYNRILADNPTRDTRTDFNTNYTEENTNTLFTSTESINGSTPVDVYYFAGQAQNNWVKFGGFYWRIIRTNYDKSIRLLYHGTSTTSTEAYIGTSKFNENSDDPMYVGYKYGTSGSLENNRTNENNSVVKTYIDKWYKENLLSYTRYLSTSAVYCNDRELASGQTYSTTNDFNYASYERIVTNMQPSYNCTNTSDAFSVNNTSAKLTYPLGLMTVDEIVYAGGKNPESTTWYYYNSDKQSSTGSYDWWLISPYTSSRGWHVQNSYLNGYNKNANGIPYLKTINDTDSVRPVISIKGDSLWKSGDGSASNPYEIEMN